MAAIPSPVPLHALIVKLAAIGDVAMALPMVSALRAQHPGCRIAWLCGESARPLLACVGAVDELIVADDRALLAGSPLARVAATLALWRRLAGRRFDLVLTAHADPRYRRLTQPVRAGARRALGAGMANRGIVPGRYHGDEYVRLVTGRDDYRAQSFPAPPIEAALSAELRTLLTSRNRAARPLVALAPGGARNLARDNPLRRWPLSSYAALAGLLEARGYATVLVGAASDAWTRSAFDSMATIDLIGRTSLPHLIALFRACAAVVTHDSGPLHLARLAGAPRVALFGPTDPAAFAGERKTAVVLWPGRDLPCAPCYDGREFAACADNLCMQKITPNAALEAVLAVAAGGKPLG
jgi:lipopolysaccharide heptosyltransferase II